MFGLINTEDIYKGTIKRCLSVSSYDKYGESRFVPDFKINSMMMGTTERYVDVVETNALLVRIDDNFFMKIEENPEKGPFKPKFVKTTISTFPINDYDLFVDKKTLTPYVPENLEVKNGNVKVKQLAHKRV